MANIWFGEGKSRIVLIFWREVTFDDLGREGVERWALTGRKLVREIPSSDVGRTGGGKRMGMRGADHGCLIRDVIGKTEVLDGEESGPKKEQ